MYARFIYPDVMDQIDTCSCVLYTEEEDGNAAEHLAS